MGLAVDRLLVAILPGYKRALHWGIAHPIIAVVVAYSLLALSLTAFPLIKSQFFPPAEGNKLLIDVHLPASASPLETRITCAEIIRRLQQEDLLAIAWSDLVEALDVEQVTAWELEEYATHL